MQLTIVFNSLIANCYEMRKQNQNLYGVIVLKVIITVATTLAECLA